MVRIGVLGAGHLGKIHLKLLKEIPDFELVGFYDPDETNAKYAAISWRLFTPAPANWFVAINP